MVLRVLSLLNRKKMQRIGFYPKTNGSFPKTPSESFNHQPVSKLKLLASESCCELSAKGSQRKRIHHMAVAVKQRIPSWESWLQRWCCLSNLGVFHVGIQRLMFTSRLSVTFRLHIWRDHQLPRVSSISQTEISVVDKVEKVRLAEGNT